MYLVLISENDWKLWGLQEEKIVLHFCTICNNVLEWLYVRIYISITSIYNGAGSWKKVFYE